MNYGLPTGAQKILSDVFSYFIIDEEGKVIGMSSSNGDNVYFSTTALDSTSNDLILNDQSLVSHTAEHAAMGLEITPATDDSTGITAAIAVIKAMSVTGCGSVRLKSIPYTFTASVVVPSGIAILGAGWSLTQNSNVPEAAETLTGGTICVGDFTFPAFIGNADDQASPTTALSASGSTQARLVNKFASNALNGVQVRGVGLKNFTYGIKFGGVNNYGLLRSYIDNIYCENCSVWGVSFENFQYSQFSNIFGHNSVLSSAGGIRFAVTIDKVTSGLIPGDSFAQNLMFSCFFRNQRGLLMEVADGMVNSLHNFHINKTQVNRMNESAVYNTVTVNNSSAIPVTNSEYFPVGMPVWFKTTGDADFTYGSGLNTQGGHQIYFVSSRSAATGAGNLTLVNRWGSAVVTTTGGSATYRIYTGGYSGVEMLAAVDAASNFLHCNLIGIAAEGINNPSLCAHGLSGGTLNLIDVQATAITNLVLRYASCIVEASCVSAPLTTDFDSAAATVVYMGPRSTLTGGQVGPAGVGIWNNRVVTQADPSSVAAVASGVTTTRTVTGSNGCQLQIVASGAAAGIVSTVVLPTLRENYAGYCPVFSPTNQAAAALQFTTSAVRAQSTPRTTGFDLVTDVALPNGTYLFNVMW